MKQKIKVIGIDLGGSKILMEAFDENMTLLLRIQEKTATESEKSVLNQIYRLIESVHHPKLKAIGLAVSGPVDPARGRVAHAPHLPFQKNLPLQALLKKRYKGRVLIENDVNAFLFAESRRPKLSRMKHVLGVMIGTGVGGAMMMNGTLYHGKNGGAGEVGHMVMDFSSRLSTFEQKTGGSFISTLAISLGIEKKMTSYDLIQGTPEAKKVVRALVQNLGLGLANLNLIFNPEAIVLGGSIYHLFLADHKAELKKIIAQKALDSKSPPLVDGSKRSSVAKGMALLALMSIKKIGRNI